MIADALATSILKGTGVSAVAVVFLLLLSKLVDKHKPILERRAAELENHERQLSALRAHAEFLEKQLGKYQRDLEAVREATTIMAKERHRLYSAITRSMTKFPDTSDWWDQELRHMSEQPLDREE